MASKLIAPMASPSQSTGFFRTLSWAVYLGCSWTWCIGMFLPVIMVREYGVAAWFVFAIPNVLGAAAMGWVLNRPDASEHLVANHRTACVAFSAITLAFHAYFLIWLSHAHIIPVAWSIAAIVAGTAFAWIGRSKSTVDLLLAWMVLAVSLAVLIKGLLGFNIGDTQGIYPEQAKVALPSLAPVCLFGFLLCPYLDLTFHRARQSNSISASKLAFGIGFGVVFLAMIFLTLLYTGDFADATWADRFGSFGKAGLMTWVAAHMAAQSGFTWTAHLRALPRLKKKDCFIWLVAAVMVGAAAFFLSQQEYFDLARPNMLTGDAIYRIFMAFYGLVFPAYVWMFMVPIQGQTPARQPKSIAVFVVAILIAALMFWGAFIAGHMLWLWPALAIVLASRWVAK